MHIGRIKYLRGSLLTDLSFSSITRSFKMPQSAKDKSFIVKMPDNELLDALSNKSFTYTHLPIIRISFEKLLTCTVVLCKVHACLHEITLLPWVYFS